MASDWRERLPLVVADRIRQAGVDAPERAHSLILASRLRLPPGLVETTLATLWAATDDGYRAMFDRGRFVPPTPTPIGAHWPRSAERTRRTFAARALRGVAHDTSEWDVRSQGRRPTCVAFAAVALVEHAHGRRDLSEQYLWWAIQDHHDPSSSTGSTLAFAQAALAHDGICPDGDWRYVEYADAPVGAPSSAAANAAAGNRPQLTHEASPSLHRLHQALVLHPIAVTLPVYRVGATPYDNWTLPSTFRDGSVEDPDPLDRVTGGHAVCVVGYDEVTTKYHVRNSWGPRWGATHPLGAGYGSITASYMGTAKALLRHSLEKR